MGVRRELAGTWLREDFPFPSPGPASRQRMSLARCIMGVSFTEDQTPQGLALLPSHRD